MIKGVLKNLFYAVSMLILIFCVLPAKVNATEAEDFDYEVNDGKVTITGFKGVQEGDLVIPNEINGMPVTEIGESAFFINGFTGNLIIPGSVTTIGESAFDGCSGFTGNLIIPDSVTTIGDNAFKSCSNLTSLKIGKGVESIGECAFSGCSGFMVILTIPDSVTTIGESAFDGCSGFTGNLIIPDSVTTIGESAFYNCNGLTGELTIPGSVTTIGERAFAYCSGFTGELTIPGSVTTIGDYAFNNCSSLTSLKIGKGVESIGNDAFGCCSGFLGTLTIPDSVTTIGASAFNECSGFTGNLIIPGSVTTIGAYAFECCSGFTGELIIPDSVTTIEELAFLNCSGFSAISVPFLNKELMDKYTGWEEGIFDGCTEKFIFRTEYEVSFDKNNAASTGSMKKITTKNHKLTLPECGFTAPEGYRFAGWSLTPNGEKIAGNKITVSGNSKNVKIYALWKKASIIEQFTERMYTKALDRSAEPAGLKYWADRLEQQIDDGANVAYGFITSTEFKSRNLSDDQFVETMYQTFFDRESDSVGKTYWMNKLNSGASKEMVLAGFVVSEEFGDLCSKAGIERGLILEDGTPVNAGIYQFVKRQYTCCLQRDGERAGMDYWATKIAKREVSAVDAAKEFFFSAEFEAKGLSDKQFVERLYETFLGRPFDEVGYAYWNDKMSKGETRREVIDEFAASEEFKGILRSYGL